MNLKNRIEKLEMYGGRTETSAQWVGTFDWMPPTDTIEQWQAACKLVNPTTIIIYSFNSSNFLFL